MIDQKIFTHIGFCIELTKIARSKFNLEQMDFDETLDQIYLISAFHRENKLKLLIKEVRNGAKCSFDTDTLRFLDRAFDQYDSAYQDGNVGFQI